MTLNQQHHTQNFFPSGLNTKICILVFPPPRDQFSIDLQLLYSLRIRTLVASSPAGSGANQSELDFIDLPFITDTHFAERLNNLINKEQITHIFSDNEGVWHHLNDLKTTDNRFASLNVLDKSPFQRNWARFRESFLWGSTLSNNHPLISNAIERKSSRKLTSSESASLHYYYGLIPGQSDFLKLQALIEIFPDLPKGDIVEIGSLYGRSGFALARLSEIYGNGIVFCIDPWNIDQIKPQGPGAEILEKQLCGMSPTDTDHIYNVFLTATSILDNITHIRNVSENAIAEYAQAATSGYYQSSSGKRYPALGQISLLHIDGNHRYEHVMQDVELWSLRLSEGGFLILDDYIWNYGDGPRRVGDSLISSGLYSESFVLGDSLYLRK
jgi:hypothetical protein